MVVGAIVTFVACLCHQPPCGDDRCVDDVMQKGDKAEEGRRDGSAGGQWMGGASLSLRAKDRAGLVHFYKMRLGMVSKVGDQKTNNKKNSFFLHLYTVKTPNVLKRCP